MFDRMVHKREPVVLMLCVLLFFTFTGTGYTATYQPNSGHLRGFIYKANEKDPFWGAQVVLQHVKSRQVFRSNVTDSKGDFRLLNVPAGDYTVYITAMGKPYILKKIDFLIKILDKKTTTISFSLKKPIRPPFFLFDLCCSATIIAGTAAGITLGKILEPPEDEEEVSPTQR